MSEVLSQAVRQSRSLPRSAPGAAWPTASRGARVYVVDDDDDVHIAIMWVLESDGQVVAGFPSSEAFLAVFQPADAAGLLMDASLPGVSGKHTFRSCQPV